MMRKIALLITILVITSNAFAQQGFVILTQYYEGASFDKWVEITNVGDATLDLTSPQLYLCAFNNSSADSPDGQSPTATLALTGSLEAGGILLFSHTSAAAPAYAAADQTSGSVCNFNGDDLVIISTADNATAWANRIDVVGDGTTWGANTSFTRNIDAIQPSTSFVISNWTQNTTTEVDNASSGNLKLGEFGSFTPLPVELSTFTASVNGQSVSLNWETATELNNYGFEVERANVIDASTSSASLWEKIGFVEGYGTVNSPKSYSFVDASPVAGMIQYRLKQIDFDGKFEYSKVVEVEFTTPAEFELAQNYPNPFNPTTNIKFTLPEAAQVRLSVFNMLGEEVGLLANQQMESGIHTVEFDASNLSTGIY
ncbi:MAG: T9SS type A sorting domain-containing protein, partial [Melioribacteraceae bacterium]|nr:T9SS type A sorting domain-containing protein [Melioribacteraceae bacterium]